MQIFMNLHTWEVKQSYVFLPASSYLSIESVIPPCMQWYLPSDDA